MNDLRETNLTIKVTKAERERMHRTAASKGLTLSALIRVLILNDGKVI